MARDREAAALANRPSGPAGSIAEDFKLFTGTWVSVATVRGDLVSGARVLSDGVVAGHHRDEVTALAWINQPEARALEARPYTSAALVANVSTRSEM